MLRFSENPVFDVCCAVNDHGGQVAPWEEDSGFYGIMVGAGYIVIFRYNQSIKTNLHSAISLANQQIIYRRHVKLLT